MSHAEIARRQFNALAPSVLVFDRVEYKRREPDLLVNDTTFRAGFYARKRRGDVIAAKLDVRVEYLRGPDEYRVTITAVDPVSLESRVVGEVTGWCWDRFEDLQILITCYRACAA